MDLLTVGEAFEDVIFAGLPRLPRLGEVLHVATMSLHPGGGAIITAIAAARLGLRVSTITAVSDRNAAALQHERVHVVNLRRKGERSAVTVALSTRRDRAFVTFEGVNQVLEPRLFRALRRVTPQPRHVHCALIPERCDRWVRTITRLRRAGVSTSWDFGWHPALAHDPALPQLLGSLDWVFVNEREALLYSKANTLARATQRWRRLARGVVMKLGANGVAVLSAADEYRVRSDKVEVVDTTGAGDSFNAGFLAALLAGATPDDAARLGNYIGARSVTAAGGVDGLPHRHKLPRWARGLLATSANRR